jgi:ABC-2 type transport system ATP-binding protein
MNYNNIKASETPQQSEIPIEILRLEGLSKRYGNIQAVNKLDLNINKGQVYGLLGPNGSGKTTTLGIILGILRQTSGNYYWFGKPSEATLYRRIGSLLERPNFYPYLSAVNNLQITALIRGVNNADIESVLHLVDLYPRRNHKVHTFSYGMKQRLALASVLLGEPEVLILDEPTNGLDPEGIFEIRNIIGNVASTGTTVLLASHLLDEVQKVCTHVAILHRGIKKFSGPVAELLSEEEILELSAKDLNTLESAIIKLPEYLSHKINNQTIELKVKGKSDAAKINHFLHQNGVSCSHISMHKHSLEQNFLELLQKSSS